MNHSSFYLRTAIIDAMDNLSRDILDKQSFLNHQVRDLPGCWPSERPSREAEIVELKLDLASMLDARSKLDTILLSIQD